MMLTGVLIFLYVPLCFLLFANAPDGRFGVIALLLSGPMSAVVTAAGIVNVIKGEAEVTEDASAHYAGQWATRRVRRTGDAARRTGIFRIVYGGIAFLLYCFVGLVWLFSDSSQTARGAVDNAGSSERTLSSVEAKILAAQPGMPVRVLDFKSGQTRIYSERGRDHVLVVGPEGKILDDFICDHPDFESYHQLFADFRTALEAGDSRKISELVEYPLQVNGTRHVSIPNRASLVAKFSSVFDKKLREQILEAEPSALACRESGVRLGKGVLWARRGSQGVRVHAINP